MFLLLWCADKAESGRREETADAAAGRPEGFAAV